LRRKKNTIGSFRGIDIIGSKNITFVLIVGNRLPFPVELCAGIALIKSQNAVIKNDSAKNQIRYIKKKSKNTEKKYTTSAKTPEFVPRAVNVPQDRGVPDAAVARIKTTADINPFSRQNRNA
jgi:hypothetical protein